MDGGIITGNTSVKDGGGVYVSDLFTLGGTAQIIGNVKGGTIMDGKLLGGSTQNVFLPKGKYITVGLAESMKVGVTATLPTMTETAVFTANAADGCLNQFCADDSANYKISYEPDKKLKVKRAYDSTIITVPSASILTYNETEQALVSAGTAYGGTMNYAIGINDSQAPETG